MQNLVLLGAPGSGKGTLATELCPKLGIKHISTGDLLREVIASGSVLGQELKAFVESGSLVPDEAIGKMMKETIASPACAKGVLLDGFPRTVPQADMLGKIMQELGRKIDHVFYLDVDLTRVIKRLTNRVSCKNCGKPFHLINMVPKKAGICDYCGGTLVQREDDKEETIRKRYETFLQKTQPLIDYYKGKKMLIELKTTDNPKETLDKVFEILSVKKSA